MNTLRSTLSPVPFLRRMGKFLCLIGFHKWKYKGTNFGLWHNTDIHSCDRCGKMKKKEWLDTF